MKIKRWNKKRKTDEEQYSVLSWSVPVWSWWRILMDPAGKSDQLLTLTPALGTEMTKWFVDFGIEICGFLNCDLWHPPAGKWQWPPWLLLSKSRTHQGSTLTQLTLLWPPKRYIYIHIHIFIFHHILFRSVMTYYRTFNPVRLSRPPALKIQITSTDL